MALSNPAAFASNATSIDFGNRLATSQQRAQSERHRDAQKRPQDSNQHSASPLPDWDRFWSDLPIDSTSGERGNS